MALRSSHVVTGQYTVKLCSAVLRAYGWSIFRKDTAFSATSCACPMLAVCRPTALRMYTASRSGPPSAIPRPLPLHAVATVHALPPRRDQARHLAQGRTLHQSQEALARGRAGRVGEAEHGEAARGAVEDALLDGVVAEALGEGALLGLVGKAPKVLGGAGRGSGG